VNTARGELVDEAALADAIRAGQVGGAGLDVFETEPPPDGTLTTLPQVVATPHIAASTVEAQELVGTEIAANVRDFLRDGVIRNAVNFPGVPAEEFTLLRPWMVLADRLGTVATQLGSGRTNAIGIRYYGPLVSGRSELVACSVVAGVLRPILSSAVTVVNARQVATDRGIDIVETRSTRPREFTNLLSVKLHTSEGERWIEGTVFEPGTPRLVSVDGVEIEAPLEDTLIVIDNDDQPGVIGDVGTILGRHRLNIASFALGRSRTGAVGVVNVDVDGGEDRLTSAVEEIRRLPAIRKACLVRLAI
jgi:D-3-phosphoglycerate dehydrogenase